MEDMYIAIKYNIDSEILNSVEITKDEVERFQSMEDDQFGGHWVVFKSLNYGQI